MYSIGLCMIVKDEAHVIERCLDSVRQLVDRVLIVDTGSQDGTQNVIRSFLDETKLPGDVVDEAWRDFAWNRNFAIKRLGERVPVDFALMIDADEMLIYDPGFDAASFKVGLHKDFYDVEVRLGASSYVRPMLFRNVSGYEYRGVLHEFLEAPQDASHEVARGFHNKPVQDSARNQNLKKYEEDAATLEAALQTEQDPFLVQRYTFYLAQSYRDCGKPETALRYYLRRADMQGWDQEVFVSFWQAARIKEQLGHPGTDVIGAYLKAYEACPARAESLHGLLRFCRTTGNYAQGYLVGRYAITMGQPETGLFLEGWIYDYCLLDEFAVLSYWTGRYRESLDACMRILESAKMPSDQLARIEQNADFAIQKLKGSKS